MPKIPIAGGAALHCAVDDYLWPWQTPTPVLMLHGFARNARFWKRWVPTIADTRRVYRPDLLGCGESDPPPAGYRFTPETIAAQIIAMLDALSMPRVHWVGESSGGIVGVLLAAVACGSAFADCRDDLVKADQHFNRTRSDLQKAATATPPVKCAAYRRHIASLTEVRKVFARCDTSANKEANAAQTNMTLAAFTKQMHASCSK